MNCRNCKSDEVEIFHDKVWSVDNGKVYKCNECELIFIDPMMSEDEEKEFFDFVSKSFSKKRKKFLNNFKDDSLTIKILYQIFEKENFDLNIRAEDFTLEDFMKIFKLLKYYKVQYI